MQLANQRTKPFKEGRANELEVRLGFLGPGVVARPRRSDALIIPV